MINRFVSTLDKTIFRKDKIVDMCKGEEVLHLGFVQHADLYKRKILEGDWLHSQIADVAERVVGIDYLSMEVQEIEDKFGYEVYTGDVTRLDELGLEDTFDVIVCGELIEHLENPGLMLAGVQQFMRPESVVIFTTPNPWSLQRIRLLKRGILEEQWLNPEHAMWFSFQTLKQIVERAGFSLVIGEYYYGQSRDAFLTGTSEGLLGRMRMLKRMVDLSNTPKHLYDGLFFVASLK